MDTTAQAKTAISPFPHLFVLFRPLMDRMMPTCIGEDNLTQSTDSNVNLLRKLPHRHNRKYFYQLSGDPLAQSSCHIKLTIMFPRKHNSNWLRLKMGIYCPIEIGKFKFSGWLWALLDVRLNLSHKVLIFLSAGSCCLPLKASFSGSLRIIPPGLKPCVITQRFFPISQAKALRWTQMNSDKGDQRDLPK